MLKQITQECNDVMNQAKDVTINYKKIDDILEKKIEGNTSWLENNPFGLLNLETEKIINFLLIYHSIGFSYWGEPKWTIETENGKFDGGNALFYILVKNIDKITNFAKLQHISKEEFSNMLKGNVTIPLLEERYTIIKKVAKTVYETMDNNWYEEIKNITEDEILFQKILENFPNFEDKRIYHQKEIHFYKLAQLLTADTLYIQKIKENKKITNHQLVGCADYKIPQVLRNMGITQYSKELSDKIEKKEEIVENSPYEVEIRASMIVVIDYINKKTKIPKIEINDYLYLQKNNSHENQFEYHRTRTTNY